MCDVRLYNPRISVKELLLKLIEVGRRAVRGIVITKEMSAVQFVRSIVVQFVLSIL